MRTDMTGCTVFLPEDVAQKVRIRAIEAGYNGRSHLMRELVRAWLAQDEEEPPARIETLYPVGVPVEDR